MGDPVSDTSAADQQLYELLTQDVGQWSAATGVAAPGAGLVAQWDRGRSGLAGELASEAQNIGYYSSQDHSLPTTTRAAVQAAAEKDPRWNQLDATGRQILLELYNVQQSGFGGNIGQFQPLAVQRPGPGGQTGIKGAPANTGASSTQQNALTQLQSTLQGFGFSGTALQQLMSFAKQEVISGNSNDQIIMDLEQTPEFDAQFPGIKLRRDRGLPPITPANYISTIDSYTQIMRAGGLPAGFYDTPQDFAELIGNDVAPTELQDRISNAYNVVTQGPQEVQNAFSAFYGPSGKAALAAYVIDPSRAEPALLHQVQAAQIAGTGTMYGFGLDQGTAEKLASMGVSQQQAASSFAQGSGYQSLIHGEISDTGQQLGQQGVVAGLFGTQPGATTALQQAILGRQAQFQGTGQGLETNTGLTGLGEANSI